MALPAVIVMLAASGTAVPAEVGASATVQLLATVTPEGSTGVAVRCDLTGLGEVPDQTLFDDGAHGDGAAADLAYGYVAYVAEGTPLGPLALPCRAIDDQGVEASFAIPLTVIAVCGDSDVQSPEGCDDGGAEDDDGCDHLCQVEPGWFCFGDPNVCYARCGDGRVVGPEECDDGNHGHVDGCRYCVVQPGFECTGEPSVCISVALCGDGTVEGDEQCDDGNPVSLDGCDATCTIEPGYECTGEPSCCVEEPGDLCVAAVPDAGPAAADGGLDPGGGAGCCSSSPDPAGALLLALALLVVRGFACRSRVG